MYSCILLWFEAEVLPSPAPVLKFFFFSLDGSAILEDCGMALRLPEVGPLTAGLSRSLFGPWFCATLSLLSGSPC